MTDNEIINKYIDLTELIQDEFERNAEKYGDKLKCRDGCSQCCSQIFRITLLDAEIIKIHFRKLENTQQSILKTKAENYINKTGEFDIESEEYSKIPKIPCPALSENGSCMIYEARPVICRRFGPPVFDYKNPEKLFACELNFYGGEEIIDELLIPNQTKIGKAWDELKTLFNSKNELNKNASATIAEAIKNS